MPTTLDSTPILPPPDPRLGCIPTTVGLTNWAPTANVTGLAPNPAGGVGYRFTGTSDVELHGILPGQPGQCLQIFNGSTAQKKVKLKVGTGTAANRLWIDGDIDLKAGDHAVFQFDAVISRWVLVNSDAH